MLEIGRDFSLLVPTRLFARIEDGIFVVLVVVVIVATAITGCTGCLGCLFFGQLSFERALFLRWCDRGGGRLAFLFFF